MPEDSFFRQRSAEVAAEHMKSEIHVLRDGIVCGRTPADMRLQMI